LCLLSPEAILLHRSETDSLRGFADARFLADPDAILEEPCDVLIPSALEHQITADNAPRLQAKVIVEAANGPVGPGADAILREAGVVVLPDIWDQSAAKRRLFLALGEGPRKVARPCAVRSGDESASQLESRRKRRDQKNFASDDRGFQERFLLCAQGNSLILRQ
jgi:hypothetical protein